MASEIILAACREEFAKLKRWAEGAFAQLEEADFHRRLNEQQNSIAAIVKHLAGNMRSRWTDFLGTDGEKPDRNREQEFVDDLGSRAEILERWEAGWKILFDALSSLSEADLARTIYIRKEAHTVFGAINRQTSHYAWHVGQIVLLAKHFCAGPWKYLTVAPGGSEAFNKTKGM